MAEHLVIAALCFMFFMFGIAVALAPMRLWIRCYRKLASSDVMLIERLEREIAAHQGKDVSDA